MKASKHSVHYARISRWTIFVAAFMGGTHCGDGDENPLFSQKHSSDTGSDSADAGPPTAEQAKAMFTALEPTLAQTCGGICHEQGMNGAPAWLKGPDPYATVKAYAGIITPNAASSSLLTKGKHEGPQMPTDLATNVSAWLTVEAALLASTPEIATPDMPVPTGPVTATLPNSLGQITFTGNLTAGVLELSTMSLVPPAASGVHAAGIHIVLSHADGTYVTDQSLASADVTAAKGFTVSLDVGLVVIPQVQATDMMHFVFDKLESSSAPPPDAGSTTGGCKDVTSFTTNAVPAIQNNTCLNCHDSGGSGNGALDLSGLNMDPPDYDGACAQALNKVDLTTPANSAILKAPTGGEPNHPFQGASAAFRTAMTTWITAEQ